MARMAKDIANASAALSSNSVQSWIYSKNTMTLTQYFMFQYYSTKHE